MRVSREQAAQNKSRVIDLAGQLFREHGFDGVGVADVMASAGLTHGGFYRQFESKDDLAAQACDRTLQECVVRWHEEVEAKPEQALRDIVTRYLAPASRDDPSQACALTSLAAEVPRQNNPALTESFTRALKGFADALAKVGPEDTDEARRQQALTRMAGLVGAVILARTVSDRALSDEILAAARKGLTAPLG
ncbi:TetR/AcrR family transcriptional regulator [Methylovirgula sp. 4M-Z18]|uniref:TetR/AcrR family transcriptional regulator n=1 Tax=Methylovirgula sp. 4M-Z18 TaxID=2293567 RepID=UPI000E2F6FA5|nr:TetR/AcrR family transcriptional regulator [Methylovirgula sp. 4M-Z18]RFB79303.1 TetR/AcrR family transcriptional regulator [Methylovirgula sp. 4M-Z18]